jgi:hypothetical protein
MFRGVAVSKDTQGQNLRSIFDEVVIGHQSLNQQPTDQVLPGEDQERRRVSEEQNGGVEVAGALAFDLRKLHSLHG